MIAQGSGLFAQFSEFGQIYQVVSPEKLVHRILVAEFAQLRDFVQRKICRNGKLFDTHEFFMIYILSHICAGLFREQPAQMSFTDITVVNLSGQFDSDNNMPENNRVVNVRNTKTEIYQTNGIHPANSGYMQIADAVYREFVHLLMS